MTLSSAHSPTTINLFIEAHINNGNGTQFTNETHKYFSSIGQNNPWVHDAYLVDLNADGREDIVMFQDNCFDNGWGRKSSISNLYYSIVSAVRWFIRNQH